uniref:Uncharacterized protein n=1 Tax=Bos mutus grunniens TaxID=30521 RepID=A0A8B9XWM1_BOSMU
MGTELQFRKRCLLLPLLLCFSGGSGLPDPTRDFTDEEAEATAGTSPGLSPPLARR